MKKVVSHKKQILQGNKKTVLTLLNNKLYLQNSYKTSILALHNIHQSEFFVLFFFCFCFTALLNILGRQRRFRHRA